MFVVSLTGCAEWINQETKTVQVKVTDSYHRNAYTTYTRVSTTMIPLSHPAVYRITVEYDGTEYKISGCDTYQKYFDKIGQYVNGTLQINTYDNGNVTSDIIGLE